MHFDFAALLVIAAAVTGVIWLAHTLFASRRQDKELDHDRGGSSQKALPWYVDFSRSFFPIIVIVLILRSFIFEPFRIPSGSMEPTLLPGDFILVSKFSYGLRLPIGHHKILELNQPERGDVAVFRYPENPSIAYIKRIVGLPGDQIEYRNKQLYINDEAIPLTPLVDGAPSGPYTQMLEQLGTHPHTIQVRTDQPDRLTGQARYQIPEGQYFTLGDNRDNSRDSRYWGLVPEENLIGRAFLIWLNLDCITFKGNCNRIGSSIQ